MCRRLLGATASLLADEQLGGDGAKHGPAHGPPPPHHRLRFYVALGIVVAAVSVAAAAWRAEMFSEYASQKEGLFRQALNQQRMNERLDEAATNSDLRNLSDYEASLARERILKQQARRASGHSRETLLRAARKQGSLAGVLLWPGFRVSYPTGSSATALARYAGDDYAAAVFGDASLTSVDPAGLNRDVHDARTDAVAMAAVAIAFALALALLTVSEMLLRRPGGPAPAHTSRRWSLGHSVAASAVLVWAAGVVVAVILVVRDVPRLR